jgi:hypothetical protein
MRNHGDAWRVCEGALPGGAGSTPADLVEREVFDGAAGCGGSGSAEHHLPGVVRRRRC